MKKIGLYVEDFKKIDVDEPSVEDSVKILNGLKKYYEDFHKVSFDEDCSNEAVNLSKKYKDKEAVTNINFKINENEMVGLLGT